MLQQLLYLSPWRMRYVALKYLLQYNELLPEQDQLQYQMLFLNLYLLLQYQALHEWQVLFY